MREARRFAALPAAALALLIGACGSNDTTTPTTTPSGSDVPRTTETFTGTLTPRSAMWHPFTVQVAGTIDVTLTSLSPVSTLTVGVGVGITPTNGCDVQAWNNAATTGTILTSAINPGTFCVTVYDMGSVTDAVTYTVAVTHP